MLYSNEGLADLGITEYVHVDGRGASERVSETEFATPYWVWQRDGSLWVRATRNYMMRPIKSAQPNSELYRHLSGQRLATEGVMLHS